MFGLYNTFGLPLEISVPHIEKIGGIPDWLDIYKTSMEQGVPWERLRETLGLIIVDSYGLDYKKHVLCVIDQVHEIGKRGENDEK